MSVQFQPPFETPFTAPRTLTLDTELPVSLL